jgi:hypothetical protein
MTSHVYIAINLFNLCQQSFLPFHIYFFKCWHRLNEPTILHYIYIYLMKEGKILSTLGYFFFSIMNFTIGIRLVFVTGLRFGVMDDCLSVLFFLSLFCLSFALPLLITPLICSTFSYTTISNVKQ